MLHWLGLPGAPRMDVFPLSKQKHNVFLPNDWREKIKVRGLRQDKKETPCQEIWELSQHGGAIMHGPAPVDM